MNIKIFSQEKEIVDSRSVILFDKNSDLKFDIKNKEHNFNFTVKFNFIDNEDEVSKGRSGIKTKIDGNIINLTCYNFNNREGTAPVLPRRTIDGDIVEVKRAKVSLVDSEENQVIEFEKINVEPRRIIKL